jgi:hypothetical protein
VSAVLSLFARADAESATVIDFPTAFAPGIGERAIKLSFSRSERVVVV